MSGLNVEIKRTPTTGIYIYADGVKVAKTDYSKEGEQFVKWIENATGKANGVKTRNEPVLPLQSVSGWAYIKKHLNPILIGFATGITLMTVFSLIESIVLKIALIIHGG